MSEPNGGSAFPNQVFELGMTLRDFFAAKAMQALLSKVDGMTLCPDNHFDGSDKSLGIIIARNAYIQADAMLKEREK